MHKGVLRCYGFKTLSHLQGHPTQFKIKIIIGLQNNCQCMFAPPQKNLLLAVPLRLTPAFKIFQKWLKDLNLGLSLTRFQPFRQSRS